MVCNCINIFLSNERIEEFCICTINYSVKGLEKSVELAHLYFVMYVTLNLDICHCR